jgi:hypothetical protein
MRIGSIQSWCSFLFLGLSLPSAMAVENIACPGSIQVTDPRLVTPQAGWTAIVEKTPHQLSSVTFYDGPIEEGASLVPDRHTKTQKTETALWQLDPKTARGYWLACRYSATSLNLGHALPKGLSECTVKYNSNEHIDGMAVIEGIACK